MKLNNLKNKNLILGITALIVVIAAFSTAFLLTHNTNKPFQNFYNPDLTKINITGKEYVTADLEDLTPDVPSAGKQEFERIKARNFSIVGFANSPEGDELRGGGCVQNVYDNFIKANDKYYKFDLNSLYHFLRPANKEDFIQFTNIFYGIETPYCGLTPILVEGQKTYTPSESGENCVSKDISLDATYDSSIQSFIYFAEDIKYPLTVSKISFKVNAGNLQPLIEEVFTCSGGIVL